MSKNLIFVKRQLYALKREYGYPAAIYRLTAGATNLETGEKSVTRVKYSIDQMIVLPNRAETIGFYGPALLKAGREFAYGGFQDQDLKFMMVDAEDLPDGFTLDQKDSVVYENRKYEIVKLLEVEDKLGYFMVCNHLKGEPPNEMSDATIYQSLRFVQRVTVEVVHGS